MTSYTGCVVPNWTKFCFSFLFLIHRSNSAYNCTEYLDNFSRVINYSSEYKQLAFSNQTYFNLTLNACLLQECVYFVLLFTFLHINTSNFCSLTDRQTDKIFIEYMLIVILWNFHKRVRPLSQILAKKSTFLYLCLCILTVNL